MTTKARAKSRSRFSLKLLGVVVAVVAITTPLAVLGGRAVFVTKGDLETVIRDAGFSPLSLPSNLVTPGSIYQVSKDGRLYSTICRASETDIASVVNESKTQDVLASSLEKFTFDLDAKAAEAVNSNLNGNLIRGVQFSLRNVAVIEIPIAENNEIFVKLTEQKPCYDAVQRLVARGDLVCQGQAVLRATVEYRLVTAGSAEAVAELIGTAIKSALEGALQTSIAYDDGRLVSGVNLHYGVRINPICATLPTDELPRVLPPDRSGQIAMLAP